MTKPYGRKTKARVRQLLENQVRQAAMDQLADIPDKQLVGHLFSHLYSTDELIQFRAAAAMGLLGARMARNRIEQARIVLRRIMWNLNDESGGIGWGSCEAMGEILYHSPELAVEFKSILFSYLDPGGNFIEHEMLQRGVIWGIGTYLKAAPGDLSAQTEARLSGHLSSKDPVKRGYALRALIHAGRFDSSRVSETLLTDDRLIRVFNDWDFVETRIMDMAEAYEKNQLFA